MSVRVTLNNSLFRTKHSGGPESINHNTIIMSKPPVEPITDEELLDFCRFLTENLSQERSPEDWAKAFRQSWGVEKPNNGFLIRVDGQIVGANRVRLSNGVPRSTPKAFAASAFAAQAVRYCFIKDTFKPLLRK